MSTPAKTHTNTMTGRTQSSVLPVIVFVVVYAVFEAVIVPLSVAGALAPVANLTARATGLLAGMTGVPNTVLRNEIFLSDRILLISLECTGVFVLGVFGALVVAYPASWRSRLLGLAVGVPVLILANLLRLVAAAQVAIHAPSVFTLFHDYVFQVGMVLVAVALWAAWMDRVRRPAASAHNADGEAQ